MEISQTLENKRLATRDKLLKAAITLLKSGGHSALRFSAVADLAGISRGGLLHHFPTKEALVAAVFEVIVREQETDSLKRIESFDGGDILQALIDDATARFFDECYDVVLDILTSCPDNADLQVRQGSLETEFGDQVLRGWEGRIVEAGYAPEMAHDITLFLWNLVRGLAVRNLVVADPRYCEQVISFGKRLILEAA
ncbi:TetR family transcriptional regulator [Croceicoccus mobilis]|uniref:TetR family transcriptional regulator n=2 Tax=Pseudomonadota TaxID=1224 RepID=A0A916Z545_9SPHN|nr:TetR family transcriptional regulator [Croceicoccus mobilis]